MQLCVVRHGQTSFNLEHRYLGALDPALNETGIAQAHALKQTLSFLPDAVICSPLLRARQTAGILCSDLSLEPEVDAHFRERNVGVYEGLTQEEAQTRFPALWAMNVTRIWDAAPTQGESISDVAHRVYTGLNQLVNRFPDASILLVAHGFVAKCIHAFSGAGGQSFFDWQLNNGESLWVQINPETGLPRTPEDLAAEIRWIQRET